MQVTAFSKADHCGYIALAPGQDMSRKKVDINDYLRDFACYL